MNRSSPMEYGVNDVPPLVHLLMLSMQHVMLMFTSVSLPVIFASQINETAQFTATLVTLSMLASGIGSIIQGAGLPFIGSGYLCPNVCGPSYISLSLTATWIGGLPLMRGMILIAGLVEMILAPLVDKLKNFFPTFIIGLVVAMVGVSVIKISVASLFGLEFKGDSIRVDDIIIGAVTLLIMVLSNVWGSRFFRVYCLLIGIASGWLLAVLLVPEYFANLAIIRQSPFFALPVIGPQFSRITFRFDMLIPFVIIAITGSLKTFGNLLAAQKISRPELETVDFAPIRKGLLADGFSTALSGLLGAIAVDTSSSNVGLAGSTKVLSRWLSVAAGVIFIVFAFSPKITLAMSLIPKPVLGASLIFAGSFMICSGLKEMFSEGWDTRKTFTAGIALFLGLSTALMPELYARAPELVKIFFTDPLPTTTILAVLLNIFINLDRLVNRFRASNNTLTS